MPALQTLAVANYRSIRSLVMPLESLNLITGPNGSGKSNLYRALRLLAEAAQGGIVSSLAREGGFRLDTLGRAGDDLARDEKGYGAGTGRTAKRTRASATRFHGRERRLCDRSRICHAAVPRRRQDSRIRKSSSNAVWARADTAALEFVRGARGPHVKLRDDGGEWKTIGKDLWRRSRACCRRCPIPSAHPNCLACARKCVPGGSTITSAPTPRRRHAIRR